MTCCPCSASTCEHRSKQHVRGLYPGTQDFAEPGSAGFPLGGFVKEAGSKEEQTKWKTYFKDLRQEMCKVGRQISRLDQLCHAHHPTAGSFLLRVHPIDSGVATLGANGLLTMCLLLLCTNSVCSGAFSTMMVPRTSGGCALPKRSS